MNYWHSKWIKDNYVESKKEKYKTIKNFLKKSPNNILDIGCGFAWESYFFQKNHDIKLWLLDGDFETTSDNGRTIKYGPVESMAFYSKIEDLKKSWDQREMTYNFLDANNLNLSPDIKFDLIYSGLSCGFHYPANTYKDFILKHCHNDTKIIFDLRHGQNHQNVNVINTIGRYKKHDTVQIEFI